MVSIKSDFFEVEKSLLSGAKELINSNKYDEETILENFSIIVEQFDKLIRDVEKIIKISDGQQEYLHRIQNDLKKEIEDRIRAEEKLKYFAAIDTLTGFYNRGMGLTLLENEIKTIRRKKGVFSICYIDLNGLKYVNDNFGHAEGDELLVNACEFIKEGVRDNDILCRVGGDEFIILLPELKQEEVEKIMEKIMMNIDIENKSQIRPYDLSFSYGIVQVECNNCRTIDEIIQMADANMYEYKKKHKKLMQ
ncbi:GGDEF domain-containing protein [Clostridium sp.]|uniref:GGDEF domain-containing protein n=1 Tax=Clostridium sp. TaxID=1506 RepID=UPI002616855D|nr:GGDEF domain-containing protein [Clostridium sp.]